MPEADPDITIRRLTPELLDDYLAFLEPRLLEAHRLAEHRLLRGLRHALRQHLHGGRGGDDSREGTLRSPAAR